MRREISSWCDERGDRYRTTDELVEAERQRADRLAAWLGELGELADG